MNLIQKLLFLTAVSALFAGCGGGGGGNGGDGSCGSLGSTACYANDIFPVGGVIPTDWTQSSDATASWQTTLDQYSEGDGSLVSANINDSEKAAIEYRASFEAGSVSFMYKVSSEATYDFFRFYIDGVELVGQSGEVDWTAYTTSLSAGIHTLKWEYSKDSIESVGSDAAWIDAVTLPATQAATNQWNTLTAMPNVRNVHTANTVGTDIYVFGGNDSSGGVSGVDVFDTLTSTWTNAVTTLPTAYRRGHTTSVVGDKVYVIAGSDGGTFDADPLVNTLNLHSVVDVYDTVAANWSTVSDIPTPRRFVSSAVVNDKIYVFGGKDDTDSSVATVEEFDPATNTWTTKTPMPTARNSTSVAVYNGIIYVMGGNDSTSGLATVEAYNPATDTWTNKSSMITARYYAASATIGNKIYAVGGYHGSSYLSSMEIYDPVTNSWTASDAMPTARSAIAATVVNNRLYVMGGWNGVNYQSALEEYVIDSIESLTTPAGAAAFAGDAEVTVVWDDAVGADSYTVYMAEQSGVDASNYTTLTGGMMHTGVTSPFTHTGLVNGTTYYFVVAAVNANGFESAVSTEVSASPFNGAATFDEFPLGGSLSVDYTAPVSNYSNWAVDTVTTNGTSSSIRSGDILPDGLTDLTSAIETTQDFDAEYIQFSYNTDMMTDGNYPPPTYSNFEYYDSFKFYIDGVEQLVVNGISGWQTVSFALTPGSHTLKWEYTRRAGSYDDGFSANAVWIDDLVALDPLASTPLNVVAVEGNGQVALTWDTDANAASYNVSYGTTAGDYSAGTFNTSTNSYAITGLTNGVPVYIVVTSVDSNMIESAASSEVTATPSIPTAPPAAPATFTATAGVGQIDLNWSLVSGANSYNIEFGTTSGTYTGSQTGITGSSTSLTAVDGITNGTTYYIVVRAVNGAGAGTPSTEASATPDVAPSTPTNVTATAGDSLVTVSWDPITNASTTTLKYATAPGGCVVNTCTEVSTTATSPFDVTVASHGLVNGSTYYFYVNGVNVNAIAGPANTTEASAIPITTPVQVTGVAATVGDSEITLDWTAVSTAASYNIYYGTATGTYGAPVSVTGNTGTVTGLSNSTTYYFAVSAVNAVAEGTQSTEVSETPLPLPATPANVAVASSTTTSATITWDEPVANATSVTLSYSTSSVDCTVAACTDITSATSGTVISGLTTGTTYYIYVRGENAIGSGAYSTEITATPSALPAQVVNVVATPGDSEISLSWDAATDAQSYNIYYGTVSGTYGAPVSVTGTTGTITGLTNGTLYYIAVAAANTSGEGTISTETTETPAPLPATPTGVTATAGDAQVTISWNAITDATTATLNYSTSSGDCSVVACTAVTGLTGTSYTLTGLTNNTTYYFHVNGENAIGSGPASTEVSATPQQIVENLTAVSNDGQAELNWDPVSGASSYTVYYSLFTGVSPTNYQVTIPSLTTTAYTRTGLTNGTTYYFVIQASNGALSPELAVTPDLQAPANVVTSAGNGAITLSWKPVFKAVSYNVSYGTVSGTYGAPTNVTATSTTISGLTNGTTYYFVVNAVNATADTSANSTEVSTAPVVQPPQGLRASAASGFAWLSWDKMPGVTNYSLYYSTTPGVTSATGTLASSTIPGNTESYNLTGLTNDTTYYFVMKADASADSVEVSATPTTATTDWSTGAAPSLARYHASAVVNGKIYQFGGNSSTSTLTRQYDPVSNSWQSKASAPSSMYFDTASAVGDKIYVTSAFAAPYVMMEYDTVADLWTTKASMTQRYGAVSETVNGKVYIIGGIGHTATTTMYDPATDSFTAKTASPVSWQYMSSEVIDGKIYVMGGSFNSSTAVYSYDPALDTWSAALAPIPGVKQSGPASAVINGNIVLTSGNSTFTYIYSPGQNTWYTGPVIPVSQLYSSAEAVNDKMYVLNYNNLYIYSPSVSRYWASKASLLGARHSAAAAEYNGVIYNFGGADATPARVDWNDAYNTATDTWTAVTSMSSARDNLTATAVTNNIYVIGGQDSVGAYSTLNESYDASTDTWTTRTSLATGRYGHCSANLGGLVYVAGGSVDGTGTDSSVLIYNPSLDSWSNSTPMGTARINAACVVRNGLLYVSGGFDGTGTPLNSVEVYDPNSLTWTTLAAMSQSRVYHSMVLIDDRLLVTGGRSTASSTTNLNTSEIYNVTTNTWVTQALDTMTNARSRHSAVVSDDRLFVIGGDDTSGQPVNTVESFE